MSTTFVKDSIKASTKTHDKSEFKSDLDRDDEDDESNNSDMNLSQSDEEETIEAETDADADADTNLDGLDPDPDVDNDDCVSDIDSETTSKPKRSAKVHTYKLKRYTGNFDSVRENMLQKFVDCVDSITNDHDAAQIENDLFVFCDSKHPNDPEKFYKSYVNDALQIIHLLKFDKKKSVNLIRNLIKSDQILWADSVFDSHKQSDASELNLIENPIKVQEGIHTCKSCGSKKAYVVQLQICKSDEGFTTFCTCANCGKKWTL